MILLIDNYDSFTYNLVQYLGELGAEVRVFRNDKISVDDVINKQPSAIVLSPGPCDPDKAGICLNLIAQNDGRIPLLGVCLGHQSIGQAYGGEVVRAPECMHGKSSKIFHEDKGVFNGLTNGFEAIRYHSLVVNPDNLPGCLEVTAKTEDGIIMGLQHKDQPVHGVQFHPESIGTFEGKMLLKNFLDLSSAKIAA